MITSVCLLPYTIHYGNMDSLVPIFASTPTCLPPIRCSRVRVGFGVLGFNSLRCLHHLEEILYTSVVTLYLCVMVV